MASEMFRRGVHISDTVGSLKTLWGRAQSGYYSGLFDCTTQAAYQVPGGKVFVITWVQMGYGTGPGNQHISIGYGDGPLSLNASALGGVTYTQLLGDGSAINQMSLAVSSPLTRDAREFDIFLQCPASSYPMYKNAPGVEYGIQVSGYEV